MSASRQIEMSGAYATQPTDVSATVDSRMGNSAGYGERVAAFLRRAYPDSRQKRIATDFDVSVSTAKNWLAGQCPKPHYLDRMRARWGREFDDALNARPLESADALLAKMEELALRLEPVRRPIVKPARRKTAAPVVADLVGYRDDLFGGAVMIPLIPADTHAAHRHHQRLGEPLTDARKTAIFAAIFAARANDNRSPAACLLEIQDFAAGPRERWLVSVDGVVLQVVVPAPVLITVLTAHATRHPK